MEFSEKDAILPYRRQVPFPLNQTICGLNFRIPKNIWTLLGVVCLITGTCVYIALTASRSTETTILRQAPLIDETTTESPPSSSTARGIFDIFRRSNSAPTVRTSLGRVKGFNLTSRGGREYFGFYNVPYAEPPLGNLRFMVGRSDRFISKQLLQKSFWKLIFKEYYQPPQPPKSWSGTRDATVKGTMCVQKSRYNPDVDVEGSEDCLHTNIFTPKVSS